MKQWLLIGFAAILLIGCAQKAQQSTSIDIYPALVKHISGSATVTDLPNLSISEISGLRQTRVFYYSYMQSSDLVYGFMNGIYNLDTNTFNSRTASYEKVPLNNAEPDVAQTKLAEENFYLIYTYMPIDHMAKIFFKNGDVQYITDTPHVQAFITPIANPALRVEIIDPQNTLIKQFTFEE